LTREGHFIKLDMHISELSGFMTIAILAEAVLDSALYYGMEKISQLYESKVP
jgi:hypothetical protein